MMHLARTETCRLLYSPQRPGGAAIDRMNPDTTIAIRRRGRWIVDPSCDRQSARQSHALWAESQPVPAAIAQRFTHYGQNPARADRSSRVLVTMGELLRVAHRLTCQAPTRQHRCACVAPACWYARCASATSRQHTVSNMFLRCASRYASYAVKHIRKHVAHSVGGIGARRHPAQ